MMRAALAMAAVAAMGGGSTRRGLSGDWDMRPEPEPLTKRAPKLDAAPDPLAVPDDYPLPRRREPTNGRERALIREWEAAKKREALYAQHKDADYE
tara:strand:+ start:20870 stop:21157 length:288 start_codon:yes stop_codon:yes gene_type:complete